MKKLDNVVDYFDAIAPSWDSKIKADYGLIKNTLQEARTPTGLFKSILDIGCGTGTLFPCSWNACKRMAPSGAWTHHLRCSRLLRTSSMTLG